MLQNVFIYLTEILYKAWYLAFFASFCWGMLSVILSPCHLGSISLVIAFISGQGKVSFKRAFLISFFFSLGILLSIVAIGIITGLTGRILGDLGVTGNVIIAIVFFITGLYFLELISLPDFININQPRTRKKGLFLGFLLGLISGLALGPCTFAFMAPVLAIVLKSAATNLLFSIMVVLMFALGHCLIFVVFGTFGELVPKFLNWDEKSQGTIIMKKIVGIIFILIGIYVVYGVVTS